MKKVMTIAMIACSMYSTGSIAQDTMGGERQTVGNEENTREINFGLKAGVNFSNVYEMKEEGFVADGRVGFVGGAFASIPITEMFGFQPEVHYSVKGFKSEDHKLYNFDRKTQHIDVPLQAQYMPTEMVAIVLGPQYSYILKKKDSFPAILNGNTRLFETDATRDHYLGLVGGVDVTIMKFVVSGRAGFDFNRNNGVESTILPRYRNAWLQATLGFKI